MVAERAHQLASSAKIKNSKIIVEASSLERLSVRAAKGMAAEVAQAMLVVLVITRISK